MPRRVFVRKVGRGYKGHDFYCKECRVNLRCGMSKYCLDCTYAKRTVKVKAKRTKS